MIESLVDTSLSIDDRIARIKILLDYVKKSDYEMVLKDAFVESLNIYTGQKKRIANTLYDLIIEHHLEEIFKHPSVKNNLKNNMLTIKNGKILVQQ